MIYISGRIDPRGVPGVTWARAAAAYKGIADDANGVRVESVATGVPRDSHLPGAGVPMGLLVEPARENLWIRSTALANAAYTEVNTPAESAVTAPDGTTDATTLTDDTAATYEARYQNVAGIADTTVVTMSFYARVTTSVRGELATFDGATWPAGDAAARMPFTSALWARYAVTRANSGGGDMYINHVPVSDAGTFYNTGTSATGAASFWQCQGEIGRWASSPIVTAAAAATRPADVFSVATDVLAAQAFTASYGFARFVWTPAFSETQETGAVVLLGLDANTDFRYDGADDKFKLRAGGATVLESAAQTFTANSTVFIFDVSWNGLRCNFAVSKNGTAQTGFQSKTAWVLPTLGATIAIGGTAAGASQAGGTYSEIQLGRA